MPRSATETPSRSGSGGHGITRRSTKKCSVSSVRRSRTRSRIVCPFRWVIETPWPMQPTE
jgi:hypothetical protein